MLFNSIDFAIFLPLTFILYWLLSNKKLIFQNLLIVICSYIFYGWWDWRFLSLIIFSTIVDYSVGISLSRTEIKLKRQLLLWTSIVVNIGFLAFFKYYNFFLDNFLEAFSFFGSDINASSLNIILPVGISFYTFQTLSYTIDVYRKQINPTKDIVAFSAFVSFFPQLVAGPIERAKNLLPQFYQQRVFSNDAARDGLKQILWGLFKKIVIADNCAVFANMIFDNHLAYSGSTLFLGSIFFAFQIYGDFSGYSDIAIGTSRLFGFNLKPNFAFPYFSRDIGEFWRRWHISLSTWFRDYLYIPLGGSQGNKWVTTRNIILVFTVSGFWHGANWTFIFWGFINAVLFLPLILTNRNRKYITNDGATVASFKPFELLRMVNTFILVCFTWIFFRAENLDHAFSIIAKIFSYSIFTSPIPTGLESSYTTLALLVVFILIEWMGRTSLYAIQDVTNILVNPFRWIFYLALVFAILFLGGEGQQFIYFQF